MPNNRSKVAIDRRYEVQWKTLAKNVANWTTPPAIQDVMRASALRYIKTNGKNGNLSQSEIRALCERNRKFQNRHSGQRCFVLATGPSIREQDLTPLNDEWCIAVSEFYRHERYEFIRPAYYAFAPNHRPFTDEDFLGELAEMKDQSLDETFFFALKDKAVAQRSKLVSDSDRLHYLDFTSFDFRPPQIDLTTPLPRPCSAALMGVWIAIYMGFAEVYLVGCDHDLLWKWDGQGSFEVEKHYGHFYDGPPSVGYDTTTIDSLLRNALEVRVVYRWTNQVASEQGTKIINANPKSYLDVIPRVAFDRLFENK